VSLLLITIAPMISAIFDSLRDFTAANPAAGGVSIRKPPPDGLGIRSMQQCAWRRASAGLKDGQRGLLWAVVERRHAEGARTAKRPDAGTATTAAKPVGPKPVGPGQGALTPSAATWTRLQRSIGNAATLLHLGQTQPAPPVIRRFITVGKESFSPAKLATDYDEATKGGGKNWGRARAAYILIEQEGVAFGTREELDQRFLEVMELQKDRAIQPLTREKNAGKVAFELDYYWASIKPVPKLILSQTYQTSWDLTGGWGAEYVVVDEEKNDYWVIHVHRGPNGGLKSGGVKTWAERGEKEATRKLKAETITKLGILQTDPTKLH
jgi:hypothetical protein